MKKKKKEEIYKDSLNKHKMINEGKKKEIIKIHLWEGFVEVLHYGDKILPFI